MKCPGCGHNITLSDADIASQSADEIAAAIEELNHEEVLIQNQLTLSTSADLTWRRRAKAAISHKRAQRVRLSRELNRRESQQAREFKHESEMNRDQVLAERLSSRVGLFYQAARKVLTKEQRRQVWEEARMLNPDHLAWRNL